jgi:hypothetical protein
MRVHGELHNNRISENSDESCYDEDDDDMGESGVKAGERRANVSSLLKFESFRGRGGKENEWKGGTAASDAASLEEEKQAASRIGGSIWPILRDPLLGHDYDA